MASWTVLFVEDEPVVQALTCRIIEAAGMNVVAASSGAEALGLFDADPWSFDAVITDLGIGALAGDALVKRLRGVRRDLPIAGTSGSDEHEARERFIAAGADVFWPKPFRVSALVVELRALLLRTHQQMSDVSPSVSVASSS